jgi:1,2-dihydroxy-3-keto-5-methylthiopentene dioxygenase
MAVVSIAEEGTAVTEEKAVRALLSTVGVEYECWDLSRVHENATADEVLAAYADEVEELKARCGFVTADVVDITPELPGLDGMLSKFDKEHTHSDDEVRFVIGGRGIFFLNGGEGRVLSVEVVPGDMIRVPRGTSHWFTLCTERRIRAIRWFQDPAGWSPNYTWSGVDREFEPLCFGPTYIPSRATNVISL